jgi:hypothetical protein
LAQPPFPLKPIFKLLNARLEQAEIESAGRLDIDQDGYRVVVRRSESYGRRRFTAAHELGHILIYNALADEPEAVRALRRGERHEAVEHLCDLAAAELLLPREPFAQALESRTFSAESLVSLHELFQVSWAALLRRICELTGGGVSLWRRYRRHSHERLALRVQASYGSSWLPRGLTDRHVEPNLVAACLEEGPTTAHVEIRISSRPRGSALAIPAQLPTGGWPTTGISGLSEVGLYLLSPESATALGRRIFERSCQTAAITPCPR